MAFDPLPEFTESGHIIARHLDDKAGVAALLLCLPMGWVTSRLLVKPLHAGLTVLGIVIGIAAVSSVMVNSG